MNLSTRQTALLLAVLTTTTDAFAPSRSATATFRAIVTSPKFGIVPKVPLRSAPVLKSADTDDEEIERLKSMAAKLRSEAANLEASQKQQIADAAERAFRKFDTNQDGEISLAELKAGLEKNLKMELSETRVKMLMDDFDKTGDGTLKLEEFVTVEQFRNKLDALARDEKAQALQAKRAAQQEEEASKFLQARLDMINDRAPTTQDKLISVLPYLFPLLDGLQFARFLVLENPDNPISGIIALSYALYRSIPFGGFIAFFALSFLSGNPTINRLIRYNMQQAIFLDIALFFPGLIAAVFSIVGGGKFLPQGVTEIGSDVMFVTLLATLGYCTVSSLLGGTPDKIPIISEAVNARIPTVDMFDVQGRFTPKRTDSPNAETDEDDERKKDKKD